jgi:pimeloyl-ACP methyl ester carboxylesterase
MDGYRMRYLRAGSGPPLVLIHGLLGYSFSWRFNWQVLAERFTVYAIDLLGIGFSDRPPVAAVPLDVPHTAERMLRWIQREGMRDAIVVGTSHGGGLAIAIASLDQQRRSNLVSKLVLVAAVNPWSRTGFRRATVFSNAFGAAALRLISPWIGAYMLRRMYGSRVRPTAETLAGYQAPMKLPRSLDYGLAIAKTWRDIDIPHLKKCAADIADIPALLVWGDQDVLVPLSSAQEMVKHMKNVKLVVLERVGHLPYEEAPDEFNQALLDFLS